jgi:Tol biopolymer transport system component/tRNA A-37 threonylcarbamoyl transferase component Bud32
MALPSGTRLGPYEIVAPIGAGGMGEVYRARDTRLDRQVAIKILPQHLTQQPDARHRFEREARAISSLNHPHICTLHDIGHQDGTDFLVMEYLEGETLAKRLEKGALPAAEMLRIGMEIADALDKAHGKGILHRDLKPSNIMLTKAGAKLMDFGLAKEAGAGGAPALASLTQSLERTARGTSVTAQGTIVGTFQYMSPEQVEGKEADARSDIFSFGAVLYEMATGKRAFAGETTASVIAAVLEREPPPIASIQPMSPPALDRTVKTCLAKDPDERFHSAHDVKLQLEWIREAGSQAGVPAPIIAGRKPANLAAWVIAGVCFVAAIAFATRIFFRAPQPAQMFRSSLEPPSGSSFVSYNFAVSPDGRRLAFAATDANGKNALWLRSLSASGAQQIAGTDGAIYPFWSPNSQHLGFFAGGKLKTVDIATGAVRILCDAREGRGGTWSRDGVIIFAPDIRGPLFRIPDTGGIPESVTKIPRAGSGQGNRWPYFLPDGKHFLYDSEWSGVTDQQPNGIYAGSLDSRDTKLISSELSGNVAFASGQLVYVRDRSLIAQQFDAANLKFTSAAATIAEEEITTDQGFRQSGYSVSQNGVLVFQSLTDSTSDLDWFDASGKELGRVPQFTGYGQPRVSPDGRFVAFDSDDDHNGKSYIRVYDLARGIGTRLTDGGSETTPAWLPQARLITYIGGLKNNRAGMYYGNLNGVYEVPADGSAPGHLLIQGAEFGFGDWSPNGDFVYSDFSEGLPSVAVYSTANHQTRQLALRGAECRFHPSGKWITCTTADGIVVFPFPGPGGRIQISNGPGAQAVWSRDGKHIFYISRDKKMMAADFDPLKGTASTPRALFQTRIIAPNFIGTQYDVTPDGRFLINSLPADRASPLTLVTNWPAVLKREQ